MLTAMTLDTRWLVYIFTIVGCRSHNAALEKNRFLGLILSQELGS